MTDTLLAVELYDHEDMDRGLWQALQGIPDFDQKTVEQLRSMPDRELMKVKGLGEPRVRRFRAILGGVKVAEPPKPSVSCESCRFWVDPGGDGLRRGECHLYPMITRQQANHWCGQFEKKS